ncbi:hypothetical protein RhiirA1_508854 [Rhizophagus irregularis]|uniref:Uncharacterized protein n=1 Tax=Rhizophagus irregularis TaxID=588596 RepID=A0A2N0QS68_9GLOM|nr:hypothetical protein RhiirA1_508854 [Rhizophagus irregularis]
MIYDNLIKLLPPGTKRNTILKQTQKARNIYKLFEKIGIDKIKYITTYSANSISELSDSQIQTIIDYFSENPNTEFPDDRNGPITDSEEEISNDQDNILEEEQANTLVSAMRVEADFDKMIMEAFKEKEARIEKEKQNKTSSNVVTPAKVNIYDDVYFDDEFDHNLPNPIPRPDKGTNDTETEDDSDCNSEEEMPDDSDNEYDRYGGYNEYGECNRGYYYHDGRYERKTSPMMSPIISPVTA